MSDESKKRVLKFSELSEEQAHELFGDPMSGVRCPRCGWIPRERLKWKCTCGYHWNTFDTRGRCPGCAKQWTETQCYGCQAMSPHLEWYALLPQ